MYVISDNFSKYTSRLLVLVLVLVLVLSALAVIFAAPLKTELSVAWIIQSTVRLGGSQFEVTPLKQMTKTSLRGVGLLGFGFVNRPH
jgi:hypothetical protein